MAKKVQIDEDIYFLIYQHFCGKTDISDKDFQTVSEALRAKQDSLLIHEYYSRAKDPQRGAEERLYWYEIYKSAKAVQKAERNL